MENDTTLRFGFFIMALFIIGLLETLRPKRRLEIPKKIRWRRNFLIILLGSLATKYLIPFSTISTAMFAYQYQIGIFYSLSIPFVLQVILSLIILDLVIYTQHFIFHYNPTLWRLHQIHHIDQEIDLTTGLRFHPLEIILSALIKCCSILLLGIPFIAVILFEILLNLTALFNHSNSDIPIKLDRLLRFFVVTPDMHRVHHSTITSETNSNYGFNLPWWDRIFHTYQAQPSQGHYHMKIGLNNYQDSKKTGLISMLRLPFISKKK